MLIVGRLFHRCRYGEEAGEEAAGKSAVRRCFALVALPSRAAVIVNLYTMIGASAVGAIAMLLAG
jgi:hypothetical protein